MWNIRYFVDMYDSVIEYCYSVYYIHFKIIVDVRELKQFLYSHDPLTTHEVLESMNSRQLLRRTIIMVLNKSIDVKLSDRKEAEALIDYGFDIRIMSIHKFDNKGWTLPKDYNPNDVKENVFENELGKPVHVSLTKTRRIGDFRYDPIEEGSIVLIHMASGTVLDEIKTGRFKDVI